MKGDRDIKKKDLVDYLKLFDDDAEISIIVVNPTSDVRLHYHTKELFLISDTEQPVMLVEVGGGENMDGEGEQA